MTAQLQWPTGNFFQLGYVTGDLDAAMAFYCDTQGVQSFFTFDTRTLSPDGDTNKPYVRVGLAYLGAVMLELIEPNPNNAGIYRDALRSDGGLALHHLGYLVQPDVHTGLVERLRRDGVEVPAWSDAGGISYVYADTRRENGLFTEFVRQCEHSAQFFAQVPRFQGIC